MFGNLNLFIQLLILLYFEFFLLLLKEKLAYYFYYKSEIGWFVGQFYTFLLLMVISRYDQLKTI